MELQEKVISTCINQISKHQQLAFEGSQHRWQVASSTLRNRDPYCYRNFKHAPSRVEGYVGCMKEWGVNWLGLEFKFPLIWWQAKPYREYFSLTKEEEKRCWRYWVVYNGFLEKQGTPELPYNFSSLHERSTMLDSDSN